MHGPPSLSIMKATVLKRKKRARERKVKREREAKRLPPRQAGVSCWGETRDIGGRKSTLMKVVYVL